LRPGRGRGDFAWCDAIGACGEGEAHAALLQGPMANGAGGGRWAGLRLRQSER